MSDQTTYDVWHRLGDDWRRVLSDIKRIGRAMQLQQDIFYAAGADESVLLKVEFGTTREIRKLRKDNG